MRNWNRNGARATLKATSVLLITSVLLSVVSCSKKKERVREVITADTPWYESKTIKLDCGFDNDAKVQYCSQKYIGSDDKNYFIYSYGEYVVPADVDWENYDYTAYRFNWISVVDKATGEFVKKIDLKNVEGAYDYVSSAWCSDGKITLRFDPRQKSMEEWDKEIIKEVDLDPETVKITDKREFEALEGENEQFIIYVGDYKVIPVYYWNPENCTGLLDKFSLKVKDPDGTETKVEITDKIFQYCDIHEIPLDDSNILIFGETKDKKKCYKLDLKTKKLTEEKAKKYDWLDRDNLERAFVGKDGKIYAENSNGIFHIDMEKKTTEEVLNYDMSDVNFALLSIWFDIVECSEDSVIMFGQINNNRIFADKQADKSVLIEFKKAASNPHAGKTVLELFSPYGIEDSTREAISRFNATNSEYYIKETYRYDTYSYFDYDGTEDSEDKDKNVELRGIDKISSELAIDIMNGDGPDILMNITSYGRLNNSNCLADLTPYLGDLDPDTYFTNIIEGSKKDGALYNMPLRFGIKGIYTNEKYAGKSGVGFTLDEYEEYLYKTLNGRDCIQLGQAYYFNMLFNSMSDKFLANNKADFSGEEFAQMAEFVKNNVREKSPTLDEINAESNDEEMMNYVWQGCYVGWCEGYGRFLSLNSQVNTGTTILGTPSVDGSGPMFSIGDSVAVSASALDIGACAEFAKILLSEDLQLNTAFEDAFVINRNAFKKGAEEALKYFNEGGERYGAGYGGVDGRNVTQKDFDKMEQLLLSCSKTDTSDAAINIILAEEMPAYFLGQKKLDAVIKIAQDRAQKVLDER